MSNLDSSLYKLDQETHESFFELIKSIFLEDAESQSKPEAYITGGQPGSGKGKLASDGIRYFENRGGSVVIDVDQLRSYHPEYNQLVQADDKTAAAYTHEDASSWGKELFNEAIATSKNIVLDQVSSDFEKLTSKINLLREKGYKLVQWHVMAVHPIISRQRVFKRYEHLKSTQGYGRFVPCDVHDVYKFLPFCVGKIETDNSVDQMVIYDYNFGLLYQSPDANNHIGFNGECIVSNEHSKILSAEMLQDHDKEWQKIITQMEARNATILEIEEVKRLQELDKEDYRHIKISTQNFKSELFQEVILSESSNEKR